MSSFWRGLSSAADDFTNAFSLNGPISESANTEPDDVVKTKQALNAVGAYPEPKNGAFSGIPDRHVINGLKQVQRQNGLKEDGIMKPKGPTEQVLNKKLAQRGITLANNGSSSTQSIPAPTRQGSASAPSEAQDSMSLYNQRAGAFDSQTGSFYKTDNQGNYFDLQGNVATMPQDVRQRLNKQHLPADALSAEAVRDVGHAMGRRYMSNPRNQAHQKGSDQALHSAYTEAEQNRINTYMQENPQPKMPEGHNSWKGNVQTMGKVMGLDPELIEKAGQDAIPAMASVLAYNYLDTFEDKRAALATIEDLERSGHDTLARKLRGEISVGDVQKKWNLPALNDEDLANHLNDHGNLEKLFSNLSALPMIPPQISKALKLAKMTFSANQKTTEEEIKRRQ